MFNHLFECPIPERGQRSHQRGLEGEHAIWRLLPAGDLLLVVEDPAEDGSRDVGMGIEEAQVAPDGGHQLVLIAVELLEGRKKRVGEPQVLHPLRIPGRLQEERSQKDAQQRRLGQPAGRGLLVEGGGSHGGEAHARPPSAW